MTGHVLAAIAIATGSHFQPTSLVLPSASALPSGEPSLRQPSAGTWANQRHVYLWSDGAIYRASTEPGMITDIMLQSGEALIAVAAGDTARWVISDTASGTGADKRTHVLVKPFSAGLATNLVITTDRRTYHLQLTSRGTGGLTALSWNYPLDDMLAIKRASEAAEQARPVAAGLAVETLNFGYTISGDKPSWRPLRAFDDGRQTFVEFPAAIGVDEAPPLFLLDAEGKAELVNYRMRGRFYVIDRLIAVAELRIGSKKQRVVRIARLGAERAAR